MTLVERLNQYTMRRHHMVPNGHYLREVLAYDLKGPLPSPEVAHVPDDLFRDRDGEWKPITRPSGGSD